jgi:hypothetical protein
MARKKTGSPRSDGAANGSGESVAGYFRQVFQENPKLLKGRSNAALLQRWLDDHPGHREVPPKVKASLSNIKSILRSKRRRRKKTAPAEEMLEMTALEIETGPSDLQQLEVLIDDCLGQAKQVDREGLADVIDHLRRARNAVVWMIGQ